MDPSHEMHIQFVSNHTGSKPSEVFTASLPVPLSVALTAVVIPLIPQSILPQSRYASLRYTSRVLIHWLIENVTVICPILLSFTLLSNSTGMNLVMLLLTITSFMALAPSGWWSTSLPALGHLLHIPFPEKKPSFLTNYRAGLNLATAIAILAVDFQIFPRRFAKTETYGFSLMDVGVGSFIVANGLVGSTSLGSTANRQRILIKISPVLLLGVVRLIAVKMANYHEHVTEYGIHWNFFFTLAAVKAASAYIKLSIRPVFFSLALLLVYELGLKLGLENWILNELTPRNNLISANREGLFSFLGYLSLYYAALELGDYLRQPRAVFKDWLHALVVLVSLTFITWIGLQISQVVFGSPSRRLANFSFCVWMMTFNLGMMSCYLLVDLLLVALDARRDTQAEQESCLPVFREPYLMRFINYNGLVFFLAANLLTGLVNKTFDTIRMSSSASLILLAVYCNLLGLGTAVLYLWRIKFQ